MVLSAVLKLQNLPTPVFWIAAIFGACGMLFFILALASPGTTILIDDTAIVRSGSVMGNSLRFDEIVDARIEHDPDAQNFDQITLRSHDGQVLLIDPRFLNPDVDGLVDLLREKLHQRGVELVEGQ